jgi:hypothetical protein
MWKPNDRQWAVIAVGFATWVTCFYKGRHWDPANYSDPFSPAQYETFSWVVAVATPLAVWVLETIKQRR